MSKVVALIALIVAAVFLTLGNFWFTYGIWPKSWWSFFVFALASTVLSQMLTAVLKEDR
jgi:hypothetical protein